MRQREITLLQTLIASPFVRVAGLRLPDHSVLSLNAPHVKSPAPGDRITEHTWEIPRDLFDCLGSNRVAAEAVRWAFAAGEFWIFRGGRGFALGMITDPARTTADFAEARSLFAAFCSSQDTRHAS